MHITKLATVSYELELTQAEMTWLRGVMQNPLFVDTPEEESEVDKRMRMRFWEALTRIMEE